mgnify:CR=1 FL=1|tara:strand:- start:795 stop:1367 length:573 start_codon:yes stop_codon:yes gene_type:complete
MKFQKDFLPSQELALVKAAINKDIRHIKDLAYRAKEENVYNPGWEDQISREALIPLLNNPNAYHQASRKISVKVKGPKDKRNYPCLALTEVLKRIFPDYELNQSGCFYYPKGGFMGWHTNHDTVEDRIYITYTEEDKKSFFRYYKDESIITDYDNKGITIRRFSVAGGPPFFWHCVGSETNRFSFGYRIS